MKTIILCGGYGTRMKEETEFKPKPLVLVGAKPILWHIMKIYAYYGFNDFVLALGYKGDMIKNYFLNQRVFINDFTFNTATQDIIYHKKDADDAFQITFVQTGLEALTGERILRVARYITEEEFMITYADGVANIDIKKLIAFHKKQGTIATITGFHPYSKYGLVKIDDKKNLVLHFEQKPLMYDYVSGGFMVLNKKAFNYFDDGPMENGLIKLAKKHELSIFKHDGFWKAMDTYKEMEELNDLWKSKRPWAVWESS